MGMLDLFGARVAGMTVTAIDPHEIGRRAVEREIVKLRDQRLPRWSQGKYLFRSLRHASAWAACYVSTEAEELDAEFVSDTKGYQAVMLCNEDISVLKFAFRLTTSGLGGWTEYGIEIRKSGEFYACRE